MKSKKKINIPDIKKPNTVALKYKVPLVGEYNASIFICPECRERYVINSKYGDTSDNTIGFADSDSGMMQVIECPKCFTKWHYHARMYEENLVSNYSAFLLSIEEGHNKHFRN